MIPNGSPTEHEKIVVDEMQVKYYQDIEGGQWLNIRTIDEGAGTFFEIKTESFYIDSKEELIKIFDDFLSRINHE